MMTLQLFQFSEFEYVFCVQTVHYSASHVMAPHRNRKRMRYPISGKANDAGRTLQGTGRERQGALDRLPDWS